MIRVCTLGGVPLFRHDGLVVTDSWTEIDPAKLKKSAREALLQFTGQLVRVHPDDRKQLEQAGLELYQAPNGAERIREIVRVHPDDRKQLEQAGLDQTPNGERTRERPKAR